MPIPENHDLRIHLAPTWLEKWDGPDRDSTRDNVISEDEIADSRLQIAGSIEPSLPTAKSAIAALKASDPVTAPEIAPRPARTCHCHRCGGDMIRTHVRRVEVPRRGARFEGNICALRQVVEPRVADIAPTERVRLAVLPKERPGAMVALQPCDGARHLSYIMTEPGQDCAQPPNHTGFRESPG